MKIILFATYIAAANSAACRRNSLVARDDPVDSVNSDDPLLVPTSKLPTDWSYTGCYIDSPASRTLNAAYFHDDTLMTGTTCVEFCMEQGYPVAGTEWSRECWCGFAESLTPALQASDENDCNMPCTGQQCQACGGSGRLTVYSSSLKPVVDAGRADEYSYVGCYTDSVSARALAALVTDDVPGGTANVNVDTCTITCLAQGFAYSGVEYGGECYCGNKIQNGQTLTAGTSPGNGCSMLCKGNTTEFCGGADRIGIYQIASPTSTSSEPTPSSSSTNIVKNGDFEAGSAPWNVAFHPQYPSANLVSGGSTKTLYAFSGQYAWQIFESGDGDTDISALCVEQTFFHPESATYRLTFFFGRIANPPPGTSLSTDDISMQIFVDGNFIASADVCNPTKGECSIPAGNGVPAYEQFSGELFANEGDHTVKICAVFSDTESRVQDMFLLDAVSAVMVEEVDE